MKSPRLPHIYHTRSRREFLSLAGGGFGALALLDMLAAAPAEKVAPRPHVRPKAKSVLFLFMEGGPSHLDTFDPKPLLQKLSGKPIPTSFRRVITAMGEFNSPLLASRREWKQQGQSGLWMSDWVPHMAKHADDMCVLRSCWADGVNHSSGVCQMNSGSTLGGRPSLGSWVSYGLGSENKELPSFVVMQDTPTPVINGPRNWSAGFMPATYQGVRISPGNEPIANLNTPAGVSDARQAGKLGFLNQLNRQFAEQYPEQSELDARIASYELAYRMQSAAPEAVDLATESEATKALYGLDHGETETFGRMCLMARRLVERGVRFIQLYSGAGSKWDAHNNIESNHGGLFKQTDLPISGLLTDLKARGLLEETLVVWGGEFGRTPMSEKGNGRDHNPTGFTMWMAGGGVKGGQTIGETDELGLHAVSDRLHVHDIHATILHALGVEHMDLIYNYKGRPERATLNEGDPCLKVFG